MKPLHAPSAETVARSQMTAFTRFCAERAGRAFPTWADLHRFSVESGPAFWRAFLDWADLAVSGEADPAIEGTSVATARFFPNLRLNYTENLLRAGDASREALVAADETGRRVALTRAELRAAVERLARGLRALGLGPGDHAVAVARNTEHPILACLASTGLGATWSSTAPDLGVEAMLARFAPLAPKVLFVHTSWPYQGVTRPLTDLICALVEGLPSLEHVVALDDGLLPEMATPAHRLGSLDAPGGPLEWPRLAFDHPLFVLFSSGTTGPPKCIVHGAGGTLVEHLKEHRLHSDLGPDDSLFFHTSCGWMMWNWLVSGLASGARILVYDGSVSFPQDDALIRFVDREGVTLFGTSPVYLQYCAEVGISPGHRYPLEHLRAVLSTGSILYDAQFEWAMEHVKRVPIWSISGGTDIIGCFVLGNPNLPVYAGESVCCSLGYDVRAQADGVSQRVGRGELVCVRPFPSRPRGLHDDPEGRRFAEAYFVDHPPHWAHGDFLELTDRGTARILGRCDGVINVRGVRIGPAEIYSVLKSVPEVREAMAVELHDEAALGGTSLLLFVVLDAAVTLGRPLELNIKRALKTRCSPFHVPSRIVQVDELPATYSGKRSERAASDAVNGRPVRNVAALRNPQALAQMRERLGLTHRP